MSSKKYNEKNVREFFYFNNFFSKRLRKHLLSTYIPEAFLERILSENTFNFDKSFTYATRTLALLC